MDGNQVNVATPPVEVTAVAHGQVSTPAQNQDVAQHAGFGLRLVAVLIDSAILFIPSFLFIFVMTLVFGQVFMRTIGNVLGFIIVTAYFVIFQSKNGQTPGKKIMNIKVVDLQGSVPTTKSLLLREALGKTVSSLILGIGYLWAIWDKQKQALHDKIAGTFVIKV